MFWVKILKTTFAAALLAASAGAAAQAQELGGSLGGSAGVFRLGNPKAGNRPKPKSKSAPVAVKPKAKSAARTVKPIAAAKTTRPPRRGAARTPKTVVANLAEQLENAIAEGNDARDARNYIAAELAYTQARELDARDARPVYGLGNIYTDQQRWDEAEETYRQAIKIDPNQSEAHIALSYVLLQPNRGGNLAARFAEAERAARRAAALNPNSAMAFDQIGTSLELRGIIGAETENAYARAVELDDKYALPIAHLGRLYGKQGDKSESEKHYQKAVKLADDVPTMILVAEVLQSDNRFAESEKLLKKAAAADPENPVVLSYLGRAATIRGDFVAAEDSLTKALRISPRSFSVYVLLGAVYLRQQKYEQAEQIYHKAVPLASKGEEQQLAGAFGFAGVGDGYARQGQNQNALRAYREALKLDAKNAELNSKIAAVTKDNR